MTRWIKMKGYDEMDSFAPYEFPLKTNTYLYNCAPNDGSTFILLDTIPTGYQSIDDMVPIMIEKLGYNPFTFKTYEVNTTFITNDFFTAVMKAFGASQIETSLRNNILNMPTTASPAFYIGHRDTNDNSKCQGTSALNDANTYQTLIAYDYIYSTVVQYQEHFEYHFDVLPEELIKDGVWDWDKVYNGITHQEEGWKKYATVFIDIWFDTTINAYQGQIKVTGFDKNCTNLIAFYTGDTGTVYDTTDPTGPGGTQSNNNNGGQGDWDDDSDPVPVPSLPTTDISTIGGIQIFSVSTAQLTTLFNYLHSASIPESLVKLWQNPIQAIVSIHILPFPVHVTGSSPIEILGLPTGAAGYLTSQWHQLDLGTCSVGTMMDSYLDRSPYTKISIYLPGIGIRQLNTDDVMGKTLSVKYNVDVVSGQCVAFISSGGAVMYSFAGSMAASVPISQNNWGNTYISAATLAASTISAGYGALQKATSVGEAITDAASAMALNVGSSSSSLQKPTITRSGSIGGATSLLGVRYPYLIIERPKLSPTNYFGQVKGYPCGKGMTLGSLSGYAEIESCHLEGIPATGPELEEIESLLHQGVIL